MLDERAFDPIHEQRSFAWSSMLDTGCGRALFGPVERLQLDYQGQQVLIRTRDPTCPHDLVGLRRVEHAKLPAPT